MDNDALVAALGQDAAAAVHRYRLAVISAAGRRGLRLACETTSDRDSGQRPGWVDPADPLDIRLVFLHCPGRTELAGRTVSWCPGHGWSMSHRAASAPLSYYAEPQAAPLDLVPDAADVLQWATGEFDGPSVPPVGVELDDDPRAVQRLLAVARDPRLLEPRPG
jgi:hypothetical protein